MSVLSLISGVGTVGLTQEQRAYQDAQLKRMQESWPLTQSGMNYAMRTAKQGPADEAMASGRAAGSAYESANLGRLQHGGIAYGGNFTQRLGATMNNVAGSASAGSAMAEMQARQKTGARINQIGQAGQGILNQADKLESSAAGMSAEIAQARGEQRSRGLIDLIRGD